MDIKHTDTAACMPRVKEHHHRGLLIRGGDILEAISRVDTVVFDKTGTLTLGRPTLQQLQPCAPAGDRARLLALAAAVERSSSHPIGKAVVAAADAEGLPALAVEDGSLLQEAGSGVRGRVDGADVAIGTWEWAQRCADEVGDAPPSLTRVAVANSSTVYLVVDGALAAVLEVSDELRADAAATVRALKAGGVEPVILSGDAAGAVAAVAAEVGVSDVGSIHAEVKPGGKVAVVRQLRAQGRSVAMVGDGVNDAAALAEVWMLWRWCCVRSSCTGGCGHCHGRWCGCSEPSGQCGADGRSGVPGGRRLAAEPRDIFQDPAKPGVGVCVQRRGYSTGCWAAAAHDGVGADAVLVRCVGVPLCA